ncbi:hypothetical protein AYI69_g6531 [Smittium culicis]|uniref:Uncharacterized protein n=1 Tax=Smittium culicis TaxID=133412 RepID=A0A1R1XYS3_9FUNG|nr:hypothetical protein AYI69_g6531 [Smittium culicis]
MTDHQDINQIPMSQDQVKELIDMIKELLRDKKLYPELIEELPSIEEAFFRTPLTEEERKKTIHSCTRNSLMNYQPPPLNDSTSTSPKLPTLSITMFIAEFRRILIKRTTTRKSYFKHNESLSVRYCGHLHSRASGKPPQSNEASRETGTTCRTGNKADHRPGWTRLTDGKYVRNIVEKCFHIPFCEQEQTAKAFSSNRRPLLAGSPPPIHHPWRHKRKMDAAAHDVLVDESVSLLSKNEI